MNDLILVINGAFLHLSWISFLASFVWGIMSVFLSPCHLASIPLIIGYINNSQVPERRAAFRLSSLFALGMITMLILVGIVTGVLGRILGDVGTPVSVILNLFLFFCGIFLLELPFLQGRLSLPVSQPKRSGAYSLGFLYGVLLGPCSFAFMAPLLGIALSESGESVMAGFFLILTYGIGHVLVIIAAGTFGTGLTGWMERHGPSGVTSWVKRFCGICLMVYAGGNLLGLLI